MKTILPLTAKKFLDNVHTLIIVLSVNGTIEFVNAYAADLLQYQRNSMLGKNWFNHFVPKEQRPDLMKRFKAFIANQETKTNTNYVETRDGTLHLIEWHNTFIQDKAKKIIGTFSSGEDVTEKYLLKSCLSEQQIRLRQERLTGILEAAERERKFLAYELHDGVNQVLTTCKLLLESEMNSGSKSPYVQRAFHHIQEIITTLRELSHELNPAELGNEGLYRSALELVARINATGKIKVTTKIKGVKYMKSLCQSMSVNSCDVDPGFLHVDPLYLNGQ